MLKLARTISVVLPLVASTALGLVACSDDETTSPMTPTPATDGGTDGGPSTPPDGPAAKIRVVHASPDAPAVDVYVAGSNEPVVKALAFGATSPYLEVPGGSYDFHIRPAGAPADSEPAFKTGALTVPGGATITAVASGLLASTDAASKFRVLALPETFKGASDKATVRVVHASADAPTVGIDVGNDDAMKPEVPALERFADTGGDGVQLPAGQALQVGIVAGGSAVTAFTTPELPAGANLFLIATGLLGKAPRLADGFSILAVGPDGSIGFVKQNPVVYALHASPDAPAVDLFAGAAELSDNLAFGQLSKPIQVPPTGSVTIDFFPHAAGAARPAGDAAASKPTGALVAGERYLAVATGYLLRQAVGAAQPFALQAYKEGFAIDAAKVHVRAVHSSPDAPTVDIGPVGVDAITPVFPGLAYPTASAEAGLALAPGGLTLGVTPAGANSTIVARFQIPGAALAANKRIFAVAAGSLQPQGEEANFRLLAVETSATPWTVTPILRDDI